MFKAVGKRQLLSHAVEEEIEAAIRDGRLAVGDRLPSEMELCEQFGVSRTVMREALRMLSARRLVRIEKGRGIFVDTPSVASVSAPLELYLHLNRGTGQALDVVRARQIIEPPIAAEAARRHTAEDAERILVNLDMLKACERPFEKLSKLDMEFHVLIAEATHNPLMPLLIHPIQQLMPKIKTGVYYAVSDAHEAAVTWHSAIVEAILNRDPEAAHERMARHLEIAEHHVRQLMAVEAESEVGG
ncbi:MAG: GntR family transcriptional regulator [Nitrospiraceae bacterium]|nr:MAG: GntR family transcriptional regulator [Nitrospiraceae bacterium]